MYLKKNIFIVRRAFICIMVRKLSIYWTKYTDNVVFVSSCDYALDPNT